MTIIRDLRWSWFTFQWRARDLWRSRNEIVSDLWERLRGQRMFSWRVLEFSDGPNGNAGQKHMLCVGCGLFNWKDTGVELHWRRLGRDGAEMRTYHFDGREFETAEAALAAFDARPEASQ